MKFPLKIRRGGNRNDSDQGEDGPANEQNMGEILQAPPPEPEPEPEPPVVMVAPSMMVMRDHHEEQQEQIALDLFR